MKKLNSIWPKALLITFLLITAWESSVFAASQGPDFMQSVGKIYVVVAVIVIIFLGLIFYLYQLDRRISKIEKENRHEG